MDKSNIELGLKRETHFLTMNMCNIYDKIDKKHFYSILYNGKTLHNVASINLILRRSISRHRLAGFGSLVTDFSPAYISRVADRGALHLQM